MLKVRKCRGNMRITKVKLRSILQRKLKQLVKCSWVTNEKRTKKCGFCVPRMWCSLKILNSIPQMRWLFCVSLWEEKGSWIPAQSEDEWGTSGYGNDHIWREWKSERAKCLQTARTGPAPPQRQGRVRSSSFESNSKYLKLIYDVSEAVLENSNLRKQGRCLGQLLLRLSMVSAKWNSCPRTLGAFLNNWFSRQRRGSQSTLSGLGQFLLRCPMRNCQLKWRRPSPVGGNWDGKHRD